MWLSLCAAFSSSCAGKLEQPERFAATVQKFGAAGKAATDAGKKNAAGDAGVKAGADAGKDAGAGAPSCVQQLFKASCASIGCHAKGSPQVDLASADVASRLVDKTSTGPKCSGRVFISTTGGANLLLDKLNSPPPCGDKMPLGGTIADKDRSCLVDWVRSLGGKVADGGQP